MKIRDLYAKYDIMPQLATHQLRVGGIAKKITDGWKDRELAKVCVLTCLVHDVGNIVKFKGLTDPQWIAIQNRYRQEYGEDAHVATYGILQKEKLDEYIEYLKQEGKIYSDRNLSPDFESLSRPALLVLYADLRVSITGVTIMKERIADLESRYPGERIESAWGNKLEEYVQSLAPIDVTKISEHDVQPLFDELLTLDI